MKKAAVATPNLYLKEARELRGWSQKYVAGQLGPGRYTLHQTIADYAQARRDDGTSYERMANYFATYVEQHEKDFDELEQELPNIFAALEVAHSHEQHMSLVRCVNALFHFLFTRGLYAQEAGVHIERAVKAARRLDDEVLLAEAFALLQGNYAKGESTGQAALTLAREIGFLDAISVILTNIGGMALELKDYAKAEAYISEALEVARRIEIKK